MARATEDMFQGRVPTPRELLEWAIEASEVGIWQFDPDRDLTLWNDFLYRITGVPEGEEVSREVWLDLAHPDDFEIASREIEAGPGIDEIRHRIIRRDNNEVRNLLIRRGWINTRYGTRALVGVILDVTESERAAAQIASTLAAISDGFWAVGFDWTIDYVNRSGEQILGMSREEMIGRNLWDVFPEAVDSLFYEKYHTTMTEREETHLVEFYPPLDAWFEVRSYPTDYGIAVYFRDVTKQREVEEERARILESERAARKLAEQAQVKIAHEATHDSITGLLNRTGLLARLETSLEEVEPVTVLFLDIDRFKLVNDSLGHGTGDELLRGVARRLERFETSDRTVARIGGDEFMIALTGDDRSRATGLAEQILDCIREPMEIHGNIVYATASIGLAESTGSLRALELIRNADVALYSAKDAGRDRAEWFDEELRADVIRRHDLEQRLRDAIEADGLELAFQPAFDIRTGKCTDVEVLARWTDPALGPISPEAFIPVAEDSGLIYAIGSWATMQTARAASSWQATEGQETRFWVNISPRELARPRVVEMIQDHLSAADLSPHRLAIEVTESALAGTQTLDSMRRIAELGVMVAVDDFGTGYSSISRLGELPVDYLKIDQSFIRKVHLDGGKATVEAIVNLAHTIPARTVAEGVETAEEFGQIAGTGCDLISGYLLARPCPLDQLRDAICSGTEVLRRELGK